MDDTNKNRRRDKMINRITGRAGHAVFHVLIWCLAIFIAVATVVQIAFVCGIVWLNSDNGTAWVQQNLKTALQDTGYNLEFSNFHYSFPGGIAVRNLAVSDEQGTFLTVDYAAAGIALSPLLLRELSVSLAANNVEILRTPGPDEERTQETETGGLYIRPFSLPDLYVTGLTVNKVKINRLALNEEVIGTRLDLPVELYAGLQWKSDDITARLEAGLDRGDDRQDMSWLPHKTAIRFSLTPSSGALDVKMLSVRSKACTVQGEGHALLREGGDILFDVKGQCDDLATFNESLAGKTVFEANLTGTQNTPLLNATASLDLDRAKKEGLSTIEIEIQTQELSKTPQGAITLSSMYKDAPLEIKTPYSYRDDVLDFSAIVLSMDETRLHGSASLDIGNNIYKAEIHDVRAGETTIEKFSATLKKIQDDRFRLDVNGTANHAGPLSLKGGADINPGGPSAENINLSLTANGQTAHLKGRYTPQDVDLRLQAKDMVLAALHKNIPAALAGMTATGNLNITGNPAAPSAAADIAFSPVRVTEKAPQITLTMKGEYAAENLTLSVQGTGEGIDTLQGRAQTPMVLSLQPFRFDLPESSSLNGMLKADLQAGPLAAALLPASHNFAGRVQSNAVLEGTIKNPELQGKITVQDGTYVYERYDVTLNNIALNGTFTRDNLVIESMSADDGGQGTLKGRGEIDLSGDKFAADIDLDAANIHLLKGDKADGIISAKLNLKGRGDEYALGGQIKPHHLEITIPEKFSGNVPELNVIDKKEFEKGDLPETVESKIDLDIRVMADNQIFIRGWGLDAELGGRVRITGTAENPLFNGKLDLIRGRYEEFGKRFRINRATLAFRGAVPPSPYLDVIAETDAEDITAYVNLTGSVESPKIKFSSVPGLPEDEVLSRILFGRDVSDISPFQAVQLAQTLRRFSGQGGGGGFNPLGQLRNITGLDDLRVESGSGEGATVGAGKYINDRIYLGVEKGTLENSGAATLEFEVTPDITIESEVGQDAQAGGGVFWEWDY